MENTFSNSLQFEYKKQGYLSAMEVLNEFKRHQMLDSEFNDEVIEAPEGPFILESQNES